HRRSPLAQPHRVDRGGSLGQSVTEKGQRGMRRRPSHRRFLQGEKGVPQKIPTRLKGSRRCPRINLCGHFPAGNWPEIRRRSIRPPPLLALVSSVLTV